jgi:hypothetical protein
VPYYRAIKLESKLAANAVCGMQIDSRGFAPVDGPPVAQFTTVCEARDCVAAASTVEGLTGLGGGALVSALSTSLKFAPRRLSAPDFATGNRDHGAELVSRMIACMVWI